jgi:two-component system NtrC family sensor kinase
MAHTRHLHHKILLTLGSVSGLYLLAAWTIQELTILPSFRALERQHAEQDLERATEGLRNEIEHVDDFVGDWSGWDDTYRFVDDGNAEYIESNLESNVFREDSFDFICMLRLDGTEVWRGGVGPDGAPNSVAELPQGHWPLTHPLLEPREIDDSRSGVLLTAHGPLLLASRPITDSARAEPPNGWIMMGRFLHDERVAALARQTGLTLTILPTRGALETRDQAALQRLRAGAERDITPADGATLRASAVLPDLFGSEGLLVRVELPRSVLAGGKRALSFALLTTIAAVVVLSLVLLFLLQRIVIGPLSELTRHAVEVGESDDLSARCTLRCDDEFGVLAREFDTMVERLAESQARLLESAREGGMSEVATTVLHDVGNALQGVNTSTGLLQRGLAGQNLADLERVSVMLAEHAHDLDRWLTQDPRGKRVPPFLLALSSSLREDHAALSSELDALRSGLDHIQALVSAQQEHAGKRGALERVDLAQLLENAVQLSSGAEGDDIEIERDYAGRPCVRTEKHKLLAVLVNLVRNARQAVQDPAVSTRRIRLCVRADDLGHVRIEVADTGVGIGPAALERIFEGGFSTKRGGRGLGLHGAANSVREMDGRLWAESDGPGSGARFLLELPACQTVGSKEDR